MTFRVWGTMRTPWLAKVCPAQMTQPLSRRLGQAVAILLTLDKGIASLLQYPVHEHGGVVLFRPDGSGRRTILSFVRSRLPKLLEHGDGRTTDGRGPDPYSHSLGLAALGWTAEAAVPTRVFLPTYFSLGFLSRLECR